VRPNHEGVVVGELDERLGPDLLDGVDLGEIFRPASPGIAREEIELAQNSQRCG
jgi:hypothetical protein